MNILLKTLRAVAYALTEPYLAVILVLMAVVLYSRNKKTSVMQKMIAGQEIDSPFILTISQLVIGILAGCTVSIILSYLGIVFDENSAIDLIFLISMLLMFWSPRFVCFSYSGALLGISSLILQWLSVQLNMPSLDFLKIDVPALMTLVAVMHFVEGILVIIDGKKGAIPVFTNREDNIVGGFALQRYWVLPVAILLLLHDKSLIDAGTQVIMQSDWHPLLQNTISAKLLRDTIIILLPLYGVLGYSTITFTKSKERKTLISGTCILAYSLILFGLSRLAALNIYLQVFVLIFAPAAHEGMMNIQKSFEIKGKPKYVSDENGIMVLDVAPNSPASEMGIKSGDILIQINNKDVESENDIIQYASSVSNFLWLKVKRAAGNIEEVSYNKMNPGKRLGMVLVPRGLPKDSLVVKLNESKFQEILEKIKNRDKDK